MEHGCLHSALTSLCVLSTVHMCSIDGDGENHTALDLKLVFLLIVTYNITEQVIYHSLPGSPPVPSLPPGWMMLSKPVTSPSIPHSVCERIAAHNDYIKP